MTLRPPILLALVVAVVLLPLAASARRLAAGQEALRAAEASLDRVRVDAERVIDLRSRQQRVADRKRPDQDVIARVNEALSVAGIPAARFAGMRPQADAALPGPDRGPLYRRQTVSVRLRHLTVPELGAFLRAWTSSQEIWTPTRIELTHVRDQDDPARYDVSLVLAATYVAPR